jgi:hypothetical protein
MSQKNAGVVTLFVGAALAGAVGVGAVPDAGASAWSAPTEISSDGFADGPGDVSVASNGAFVGVWESRSGGSNPYLTIVRGTLDHGVERTDEVRLPRYADEQMYTAIGPKGDALVTWRDHDDGGAAVYAAWGPPGRPLMKARQIASRSAGPIREVSMDDLGRAVVLWGHDDSSAQFSVSPRNGSFAPSRLVARGSWVASAAMTRGGQVRFVWSRLLGRTSVIETRTLSRRGRLGSIKRIAARRSARVFDDVTPEPGDFTYDIPFLETVTATGGDIRPIVMWRTGRGRLEWTTETNPGRFRRPASLASGVTTSVADRPLVQLAMNRRGDAVVTWEDRVDRLRLARRPGRGAFSRPQVLVRPGAAYDQDGPLQVALAQNRMTIAVWGNRASLFAAAHLVTGPLGTPIRLGLTPAAESDPAFAPQMAVDGDGRALVIYGQGAGVNRQIMFSVYH